jgi:hypothetical protein
VDLRLRRGHTLCQDDRVKAVGEGAARGEQHAHVRLDAGHIERLDLPAAEEVAQLRCEKRVEGRLFDHLGLCLGSELLDRLDELCPPTAAMAPVVLALRIVQKKRRSINLLYPL